MGGIWVPLMIVFALLLSKIGLGGWFLWVAAFVLAACATAVVFAIADRLTGQPDTYVRDVDRGIY